MVVHIPATIGKGRTNVTDEPLTAGEIAANLLGAKDIRTCICAWVDAAGHAVWYKMGSAWEAIGICEIMRDQFMGEIEEAKYEEDEE